EALCRLLGIAPPTAASSPESGLLIHVSPPSAHTPWCRARIDAGGNGEVTSTEPALLYAFVHLLVDGLTEAHRSRLGEGLLLESSFAWNRPLYDSVLTQVARTVRDFDEASYIEQLARAGFTHLEANGLASTMPYEPGVSTEFYRAFYSYGPGLLQFVDSDLSRGLYDRSYVRANLERLKRVAAEGLKYGLKPGLLCYEPRAMPEPFFQRHPYLRGARVDHPFRSHVPRYTLAQDHPVSREHYRQLIHNLMREVPELAYLSVWTNDSGAGFEHTSSLYVGRNGGPYLIREWRTHDAIARAAGESAVRWMRLLQETAAEVNPDFVVSLRIDAFRDEHDHITAAMDKHLSVEGPSLLVKGYDMPYRHPRYPDQEGVAGTIFHTEMDPREATALARYRGEGIEPSVSYSPGSSFNMEPLLGTPFPRTLHGKLMSLRETGITRVSAHGGLLHLDKTPYWPHPAVIQQAQLNPERPIDDILLELARTWAGEARAGDLVAAWDAIDEAVSWTPFIYLYSFFGFVWYRAWIRPLVPNLEAVPEAERRYYEDFIVTVKNNPNNVDLSRDVMFTLMTPAQAAANRQGFDTHVFPRLDAIEATLAPLAGEPVFRDLLVRVRALRAWTTAQRNVCAWTEGVYGYLGTSDPAERARHRAALQEMMDLDIQNTRLLLALWEQQETEWILVSAAGETTFVFGPNLGDHLQRKIELTERYRDAEPYIDPDVLWRI
ncbi:MAG: hypothetical protein SH809_17630, partial [Rhodothermales bacterium]|nr:hypothetical protein [Rhodothermales bacterium]